ncbi:hypothetical protein [Janthinobacterium sp. GB4P2]|uniref:hypothetical protein n=1 Tax=Janthinobacterium sp. GB4P2 TaxID=3424189 RepID=UPI003F526FFA
MSVRTKPTRQQAAQAFALQQTAPRCRAPCKACTASSLQDQTLQLEQAMALFKLERRRGGQAGATTHRRAALQQAL